jgi:hypothetical protein
VGEINFNERNRSADGVLGRLRSQPLCEGRDTRELSSLTLFASAKTRAGVGEINFIESKPLCGGDIASEFETGRN